MADLGDIAEAYYEVEIKRDPFGLRWGEIYFVSADAQEKIGDTRQPFGQMTASRDMIIARATEIARRHREGDDIVRLDLDEPGADA